MRIHLGQSKWRCKALISPSKAGSLWPLSACRAAESKLLVLHMPCSFLLRLQAHDAASLLTLLHPAWSIVCSLSFMDALMQRQYRREVSPKQFLSVSRSTLVSLLQRHYDPTEGSIFLDDDNLLELDAAWYRDQLGVVSQDPRLFSESISENIAYGKTGLTQVRLSTSSCSKPESVYFVL